nr:hypothetical protein [Tanacetum cinerariifolium]
MSTTKFADVHNLIAFLSKPTKSEEFEQIIDFLNANPIKYALTMNPTIYTSCIKQFWVNAKAKNINGEAQIHVKVDGKKVIIFEATIRRDLKFEDEGRVDFLSNEKKQNPRKQRRQDLKETEPSGPIDEALNEENVPAQSNDSPLLRVNTLRSGEDTLKINKLMELCTKLSERFLNLETKKIAQAKEISSLKRRVKRLEKKKKLRTYGLTRLYKIGLSARVESSAEEQSFDEDDASKQASNIADIDADCNTPIFTYSSES